MTGNIYYRPLPRLGPRYGAALPLAGSAVVWFSDVARLTRNAPPDILPARDIPPAIRARLTAPRPPLCGLSLDVPRLMGIVNATPDSFSDGGLYADFEAGLVQARALVEAGADILDVGGESTRPGADDVPPEVEVSRTAPLIAALVAGGLTVPISIDTRKSAVARTALDAGAGLVNDVSALKFDARMAPVLARAHVPVCLMHARGTPKTMQCDPQYDDVLLDVYDALHARIAAAEAVGIARTNIVIDPGIGFGKSQAHNLALIRGLSLFHALGCPVLLGVSRKGFIGKIGAAPVAARRAPGSIALALDALRQGVQILRVHDIRETKQAVLLWQAVHNANDEKAQS